MRDIWFHDTGNEQIIAYSKRVRAAEAPGAAAGAPGEDDVVLTVVNLDPRNAQVGQLNLNLVQLGLPEDADGSRPCLAVTDELTGQDYEWSGSNYIRLDPHSGQVAHVMRVRAL